MPPMYSAICGLMASRQACKSLPIATDTNGAMSNPASVLLFQAADLPSSTGSVTRPACSGLIRKGCTPSATSPATRSCLVLHGVYRNSAGVPVFHEARAPSAAELKTLLNRIIQRIVKLLTRTGYLIEEQGMSYLAQAESDCALTPLQAAACTYRIALGPPAGQKVLSLQTVPSRAGDSQQPGCVNAHGFSLHAAVRCNAHQRKELERLCRYITRPAIANERLKRNRAGQVVLQLKSPWRDGTTHIVMSPLELLQRLAALVPRPRLHLIRFHGVLAPHAKMRAQIVPSAPLNANQACDHHAQISPASPARMRLKPACSSAYSISISNTAQTVAGA